MQQLLKISFASTAFNEAKNIDQLINRCSATSEKIRHELKETLRISSRIVIADNASTDESLDILIRLYRANPDIDILINRANYGPEASAANVLKEACDSDFIILLCSDLQDPPELAGSMIRILIERPDLDAILAVKKKSSGNALLRLARRSYYKVLGYSTRLQLVPNGFHGFGCYRRETIEEALRYWELTDLNLRQCLANASQSAIQIDYQQADRIHGKSSYGKLGYWQEALRSLAAGDATASRLALTIGITSMIVAITVGIILLSSVLYGYSTYSRGVPTILGLTILSFAVQMLMFSLLSRQMEAIRMGGIRPRVRFSRISEHKQSTPRQADVE